MKAKKAPPRRRISFAVDREEIEINSDWVEAVMASPAPPASGPAPDAPPDGGFFSADENSSTDAHGASGAECISVENSATVENSAAVVYSSPAANSATPVAVSATVEQEFTDAESSIDALSAPSRDHRVPRPRLIVRVTDGLTPGQYAVYSLMYEAGEGSAESGRIYKGGYADLGRLTGLSKRGLQHIVAELQAKQVISVHQQPGYHRTQTSAYRVPPPQSVIDRWLQNGWRHAIGKSKTLVK